MTPPAASHAHREPPATSALPAFLLIGCLFVVTYVSLEPFQGWNVPPNGVLGTLLAPLTLARLPWFDALANSAAYVPLGFSLWFVSGRWRGRWIMPVLFAAAISLAIECAQTALPTRHASLVDTGANAVGAALGHLLAVRFDGSGLKKWLAGSLRAHLMPGLRGDFGITLLLAYLVAHLGPGLPFFSSTFFVATANESPEPALFFLQGLHTALSLVGFGLFADLVARTRRIGGVLAFVCVLAAISSKAVIAAALLHSGLWGVWLSQPVMLGLLLGIGVLLCVFWLPSAKKRVICNVAVIVAVVLPALVPEWLFAKAPVRAFDWNYGHLLNFNLLSQTLLRLWPLFASMYLLSTAGNPYQDRSPDSP